VFIELDARGVFPLSFCLVLLRRAVMVRSVVAAHIVGLSGKNCCS
jgi:hypothetical protein